MGLREQQKATRRAQILRAARRLIRRGGADALSMRELAQAARLSHATPYNLFGSKADVLYGLMAQSLDDLDDAVRKLRQRDPIARIYAVIEVSCDQLIDDADYFLPLMKALRDSGDTTHPPRLAERCVANVRRTVESSIERGVIRDGVKPGLVARQIFLSYLSALHLWTNDQLDAAGFKAQTMYGLTMCLLAVCTEQARPKLLDRLQTVERELARQLRRLSSVETESQR